MTRVYLLLLVLAAAAYPQQTINGNRVISGDVRIKGITATINSGAALPSTCTAGPPQDVFMRTSDNTLYRCSATNTWTQLRSLRQIALPVTDFASPITTGDGRYYFPVPSLLNGQKVTAVALQQITAGSSGTTTVQVAKCAAAAIGSACSGTVVDVLTTPATVDAGETSTATAAVPAVVNASNNSLASGDLLRIDIDAVSTGAAGLIVVLTVE